MERDLLLIGTMIAVLRKSMNVTFTTEQIFEGVRLARQIGVQEAIAKEAGGETVNEELILQLAKLTTSAVYQTVVTKTITEGKTAQLSNIDMACAGVYSNITWKISIGDKVIEVILPTATSLPLFNVSIRGGTVIKVEAKTSSGTPDVWADIIGKEVT